MKLTLEEIKKITSGAERILERDGLIHFFRFSEKEEKLYADLHPQFLYKTYHTAGITMNFETDAKEIIIDVNVEKDIKTSTYFSLDIFSDDIRIGSIKNFNETDAVAGYDLKSFPLGDYHGSFSLENGKKTIKIVFPWSVVARLRSIELVNASFIYPVKKATKLLVYGDSITHGFHSMYTSNTYASKLSAFLDAALMNKAIGAEVYFPELAEIKSNLQPDIVTVAYGTNDWVSVDKNTFTNNCSRFLQSLSNNYPNAQIIAITPIWRADNDRNDGFSDFFEIDTFIRNIAKDIENISVIQGIDLVPHDRQLYGDGRIHPNDKGFEYYAENLVNKLKEVLL